MDHLWALKATIHYVRLSERKIPSTSEAQHTRQYPTHTGTNDWIQYDRSADDSAFILDVEPPAANHRKTKISVIITSIVSSPATDSSRIQAAQADGPKTKVPAAGSRRARAGPLNIRRTRLPLSNLSRPSLRMLDLHLSTDVTLSNGPLLTIP